MATRNSASWQQGSDRPSRILIIARDPMALHAHQMQLSQAGHQVFRAAPGPDALHSVWGGSPDLVIFRFSPAQDRWEFCQRLLAVVDVPLFVLLATNNRQDCIKALDLGVDDCVSEPVLVDEVIARVRALLRRRAPGRRAAQDNYYVDADLVVDLTRKEARMHGQPIALTPTEFRVLSCLVRGAGQVVSRERMVIQIWGPGTTTAQSAIKVYVHQLRKKLEPNPDHPQRIVTIPGQGYTLTRLNAENAGRT